MNTRNLLVSHVKGVGRVQLHRPHVFNALNRELIRELVQVLEEMDQQDEIHVILISGGDRFFAAGADIDEMADASAVDMLVTDPFSDWNRIRRISKPMIASVGGYALGGGCELAMICDMIIASEKARFGQPEINLGVMPGAGGTQRLTRAIGKAKAMEMVLTGRPITAKEAFQAGLINRVVPTELLENESMKLAQEVAAKAPVALRLAKQAVLRSFDTTLKEGLDYEQKLFYLLFATHDQKEGMKAFKEKRPPRFFGK